MLSLRLCLVAVVLAGVVNTHSVSLRTNVIHAEHEPYQVFVACQGANGFDFGAGIPITRRHVLTAAALVRGFLNWSIAYGSNTLSGLQYIESTVGVVHPNYNSATSNNNLAIIVLPTPFPVGAAVSTISLPSLNDPTFPRVNQEGTIVGFGVLENVPNEQPAPNPFLKIVFLTVIDNCATHFQGTDVARNFCAEDDTPNSMNLCAGDLGSAFVVTQRGQKILAGISSVISSACRSGEATSFTRTQSYLPWITSVIGHAEFF